MRVSKERQVEVRRALVRAAVDLFTEKGFAGASMREIAIRAGVAAGTIYNYFPTKEKIFFAYFDIRQEAVLDSLATETGFGEFTLKEKLQALIESLLESYQEDREFVAASFKTLLDSPMKTFTELRPIKKRFTDTVRGFFAAAVEAEEIPEQPFEGFLVNLYWDYTNLVVLYWLSDSSDGFANTSRLIDLSLDIYVGVVLSGIVTNTAEILSFLFKSHIYGNIDKLYGLISALGSLQNGPSVLRRD